MTYILGEEEKLTPEEAVKHYGIMGMKWGVRRTAAQLGRASRARDSDILDARKKAPKLEKKVKTQKTKYKNIKKHTDRKDAGRKAAKASLKRARAEKWRNSDIASQDTGPEAVARTLASIGSSILNQSRFQNIMAQEAAVARVRAEQAKKG